MSAQDPMGPGGPDDQEFTEEEMRAALEEEMRRVTVDQVLLQSVVSLINLAGRRLGLAPGSEGEKDLDQVRTAIDAVRALLPLLEEKVGAEDAGSIRNALSQLQMAYAREAGAGGGDPQAPPGQEPPAQSGEQPKPGGDGPPRSSGRLWVPGQ
jgi:hypothetical protein